MTRRQERAVERLKVAILKHDGLDRDTYEYKRFDVEDRADSRLVFLTTEVGLKGDEQTMASVFARTRRVIAIGPRGGLKLLNAKDRGKVSGSAVAWRLTI